MIKQVRVALFGLVFFAATGAVVQASVFLAVDFDNASPSTEDGFLSISGETNAPDTILETFNTVLGDIDVMISGHQGFFERAGQPQDNGAFTFGDLYRDHIFSNTGNTITLSISGLEPSTPYEVTLFAYDFVFPFNFEPLNEIRPAAGDTVGPTIEVSYDTSALPTSNDEFGFTGIFSAADGGIEIDLAHVSDTDFQVDLVRLNGFTISTVAQQAVPEPSMWMVWSILAGIAGVVVRERV